MAHGEVVTSMCLQPVRLPDGSWASCRKCGQCRSGRIAQYVGRALAESSVSDQVVAVTLTYRRDHPHSQFLVYSDFQKFLKKSGLRAIRSVISWPVNMAPRRAVPIGMRSCLLMARSRSLIRTAPRFRLGSGLIGHFGVRGSLISKRPIFGGFGICLSIYLRVLSR